MMSEYAMPMNIGNPDEVTVKQLASEVVDIVNSNSRIVFLPLPEDDPKVRQPDISLASSVLGWEPKVSRAEGMKRTLAYFQKKLYPTN
jgi:dTDP-glucose 4,6-dehydratase